MTMNISDLRFWGIAMAVVVLLQSCGEPTIVRQRHTARQLEYLAFALEAHKALHQNYPVRLQDMSFVPGWVETGFEPPLAQKDQWGRDFHYSRSVSSETGRQSYDLASLGRDGLRSSVPAIGWSYDNPDQDIVIIGGRWRRRPDIGVSGENAIEVAMERRKIRSDINRDLVTIDPRSNVPPPLGVTVVAWLIGPGEWSFVAGKRLSGFTKNRVSWDIPHDQLSPGVRLGIELHTSRSQSLPEKSCVLVIVRDNQRMENDYTDNVGAACNR